MAGITRVRAFKTLQAAKDQAHIWLNDNMEVAITGKTEVVEIRDANGSDPLWWSRDDPGDLFIVVASQDGIEELTLNS
ncbi:MAG: hypothetical protein AAGB23_14135 [Pseudomonadota bacterium]